MTTDRQHCHRSLPSGWSRGAAAGGDGGGCGGWADSGSTLTHIRHVTDKLWQLDECRRTSSDLQLALSLSHSLSFLPSFSPAHCSLPLARVNIVQFRLSHEIIFHFHFISYFCFLVAFSLFVFFFRVQLVTYVRSALMAAKFMHARHTTPHTHPHTHRSKISLIVFQR